MLGQISRGDAGGASSQGTSGLNQTHEKWKVGNFPREARVVLLDIRLPERNPNRHLYFTESSLSLVKGRPKSQASSFWAVG